MASAIAALPDGERGVIFSDVPGISVAGDWTQLQLGQDAAPAGFGAAVVAVRSVEGGAAALTHASAFAGAFAALRLGGKITVVCPASAATPGALTTELTLAGFTDVESGAADSAEQLVLRASKPAWQAGHAAKLGARKPAAASRPAGDAPAAAVSFVPARATGWAGVAGSGDLVDEDALLDSDDAPATAAGAAAGGCATKRRACANCSCGRKEQEDAGVTIDVADGAAAAPTSSCGNCWKGDAFRCATCPHLGKPAFKPGNNGAVMLDTAASDF